MPIPGDPILAARQAAIFAARRGATAVSMDDFERATERVIGGLPKNHGKMGHQEVPRESVTCRISKKCDTN